MLKVDIIKLIINNNKTILSNVKFELEKNQIYTILGVNGTGKTTLIKSLTGLLDKRFFTVNGSVIFEDQNIFALNKNELIYLRKNKIKYVFQDAVNSFDPLKTFEYYFERLAKNQEEINSLLEYFLLPAKVDLYKLYPYEVSGGMAQRINFVLVLLAQPQFIILDEPTSGIDIAVSNLILLKLKEFACAGSNAALLVTHDISFAEKVSSKIAFLNNGTLSGFLPVKDFFSKLSALREIQNNKEQESFLNAFKKLSE